MTVVLIVLALVAIGGWIWAGYQVIQVRPRDDYLEGWDDGFAFGQAQAAQELEDLKDELAEVVDQRVEDEVRVYGTDGSWDVT